MKIKSIKGVKDILPGEIEKWQWAESVAHRIFTRYGFKEIRLPIFEYTDLFKRSIGDTTDIVEKEMYTFQDRDGDSLTLRPEATAGMVRAGISNGLLHNQRQRLWCQGPMFRHEKPQRGRYRQFHQIDVEALGFPGPDVDAELILLSARLWRELGVDGMSLEINSLGNPESRAVYRDKLVAYFQEHRESLDADSSRRLEGNPLRILDSKATQMQDLIRRAPMLTDYLDDESARHFDALRNVLETTGIQYTVNPRLVHYVFTFKKKFQPAQFDRVAVLQRSVVYPLVIYQYAITGIQISDDPLIVVERKLRMLFGNAAVR